MSDSDLVQLAITEPKKVFINIVLIPSIRQAQVALYAGNAIHAIRLLRGLIDSLHADNKKLLKQQYEKLQGYEENVGDLTRIGLEQIFSQVMSCLHETYLKEFHTRLERKDFEKLEESE